MVHIATRTLRATFRIINRGDLIGAGASPYSTTATKMATTTVQRTVVGALSCQKDSYLNTLDTSVISCEEHIIVPIKDDRKSKTKKTSDSSTSHLEGEGEAAKRTWKIEFADSVLFPEGGGQHTDHGTITPLNDADTHDPNSSNDANAIPIKNIQRHGLRCISFSPAPLDPGTKVRQTVDHARRWDIMQQHTGQHLLSAIMDTMHLPTLGWSMGQADEMNYVELPRKPTDDETRRIQLETNAAIRENLPITVETPEGGRSEKLPGDYDVGEGGVVRFVRIGELDYNACCGTHLKQTSHVGAIVLHHTQSVRGTNCRLYFTAGDRALKLAAESINGLREIGISLSTGAAPGDIAEKIKHLGDQVSESRKREKRMVAELAKFQALQIQDCLKGSSGVVGHFLHRPDDGVDFVNRVLVEVDEVLKQDSRVLLVCTGDVKSTGTIVIQGAEHLVTQLSAQVKAKVKTAKGGGKGRKWQGKVTEWAKGEIEALEKAVADL